MAKEIECTGPVRLHVEVALGKEPGATMGIKPTLEGHHPGFKLGNPQMLPEGYSGPTMGGGAGQRPNRPSQGSGSNRPSRPGSNRPGQGSGSNRPARPGRPGQGSGSNRPSRPNRPLQGPPKTSKGY